METTIDTIPYGQIEGVPALRIKGSPVDVEAATAALENIKIASPMVWLDLSDWTDPGIRELIDGATGREFLAIVPLAAMPVHHGSIAWIMDASAVVERAGQSSDALLDELEPIAGRLPAVCEILIKIGYDQRPPSLMQMEALGSVVQPDQAITIYVPPGYRWRSVLVTSITNLAWMSAVRTKPA